MAAAVLGAGLLPALVHAQAQEYPARPIRLVIPFPPGGGTDFVSRTVGTKLGEMTGWTIVLENRPGAGGNIAIESVAKAAPDGYTIVMGQSDNMMLGPFLYPNVGYDSVKSFEAIVRVSAAPLVVVSASGSKITDPVSLAAAGKSARGITWGTAGNGTVGHLFGEQIKAAMGINLVQVPYKGASPAMTDLIGGAVDVAILSVGSVLPHIRSGKAQPVAVTSAARSAVVPDAKTFAEAGYKDVDVMIWLGLFAPAGTPAPIVARLNEAVNRVLAQPDIQQKIVGQGVSVGGGSAADFAAFVKADYARWGVVARRSGVKVE
ncbi:MAG: tripartite tricarboxylate transporter substrate binding protein [Betaproteobacteria bacterium]|nr:tripartite tricarboxylate transporter substrate binding protein [Betaproteobacteria bacterium]